MEFPKQFEQVHPRRLDASAQSTMVALHRLIMILNVATMVFCCFFCPWLLPAWNAMISSKIDGAVGVGRTWRAPGQTPEEEWLPADRDGIYLLGWTGIAAGSSVLLGVAY